MFSWFRGFGNHVISETKNGMPLLPGCNLSGQKNKTAFLGNNMLRGPDSDREGGCCCSNHSIKWLMQARNLTFKQQSMLAEISGLKNSQ
jgi:hypothetical protein